MKTQTAEQYAEEALKPFWGRGGLTLRDVKVLVTNAYSAGEINALSAELEKLTQKCHKSSRPAVADKPGA